MPKTQNPKCKSCGNTLNDEDVEEGICFDCQLAIEEGEIEELEEAY